MKNNVSYPSTCINNGINDRKNKITKHLAPIKQSVHTKPKNVIVVKQQTTTTKTEIKLNATLDDWMSFTTAAVTIFIYTHWQLKACTKS